MRGLYGAHPDFTYQGLPIPDDTIDFWLSSSMVRYTIPEEQTIDLSTHNVSASGGGTFEWEHVDTLSPGLHVLRTYWWPEDAMGKYTTLFIVSREGFLLRICDQINGGDRHASMIYAAEVEGNCITYSQCTTTSRFVRTVVDHFPDLCPLYERSDRQKLGDGEADLMGVLTFSAQIAEDGRVINNTLLSFSSEVEMGLDEMKALAIEMLCRCSGGEPSSPAPRGSASAGGI